MHAFAFERTALTYTMEVKRQLDVLDRRLAGNTYLCGEEYSITDIATFPGMAGWYRTRFTTPPNSSMAAVQPCNTLGQCHC